MNKIGKICSLLIDFCQYFTTILRINLHITFISHRLLAWNFANVFLQICLFFKRKNKNKHNLKTVCMISFKQKL